MRTQAYAHRSSRPRNGVRRILAITMIVQQLTPPLGAFAATKSQTGSWSTSARIDVAGTHVVLLREPQTNAAKVFMFGESGYAQKMRLWRFFANSTLRLPDTSSTDSVSVFATLPHPVALNEDLFCSGHTVLPDGRMLLMGGSWTPPSPCGQVFALDPAWFPNAPPAAQPWKQQAAMSVERWYATATMLSDGRMLATAGTAHGTLVGFGGDQGPDSTTFARRVQPLLISGHFVWGDTTAVPGNNPWPTADPRVLNDWRTAGQYPPGRDGHIFVAAPFGDAILYGGRRKTATGYDWLDDVWMLGNNVVGDDSTRTWVQMEQVRDATLPAGQQFPKPRTNFAATWAGVEDRAVSYLPTARDSFVCYIHGGIDANGHVLGDRWKGTRRRSLNPFWYWRWTRILPDNPATARFGHTMSFDPGPHFSGVDAAQYARLVIFGGRLADSSLANNHIYTYGVGKSGVDPDSGAWRETNVPAHNANDGVPVAREGHAAAVRSTLDGDDNGERQIFFFGGARQDSSVVDAGLWYLSRSDVSPLDTLLSAYEWEKVRVPAGITAPTGRWRPAMAYDLASKRIVVVGGDKDGAKIPGGLTNEIWTVPVAENVPQTYGFWSNPIMRNFPAHPGPPPIAGFQMYGLMDAGTIIARNLEVFNPAGSSSADINCTSLPGTWSAASLTTNPESEREIADYPYMFQIPDGRMFNAGPSPPGKVPAAAPYRRFYNLQSKLWSDTSSTGQADAILFGSAVRYRPGKILRAGTHVEGDGKTHGTSRTETISISTGTTPAWSTYDDTQIGQPKMLERTNHNLTLLPTGDVLVTGGLGYDADTSHAVKQPQLWRASGGRWSDPIDNLPGHNEWLASDPYIRNYHSTAILLPDARVMTAGGEQPNIGRATASIFEPPYLFDSDNYASRPRIWDAPEKLPYLHTFTLALDPADSSRIGTIRSIALMRPGAVTHGFDQDQRYIPLGFVPRSNPARLLVQAPTDSNLAPPGEYMLFVVDNVSTGAPTVPSIAKWEIVGNGPAPFRDSLDVIAPAGGTFSLLSLLPSCELDRQVLGWCAPADDDTIGFSGPGTGYDLRYTTDVNGTPPFANWTPVTNLPAPAAYLTLQEKVVSGLSDTRWYRFGLKTADDNGNTSVLSNTVVGRPQSCDGDGGEGIILHSVSPADPGEASLMATVPVGSGTGAGANDMLFPGAALDSLTTDILRLDAAPELSDAARSLRILTGGARGLSLDRVRLIAVDHAPGTEVVAATDGRFLSGVRAPLARAVDGAGTEVTHRLDANSVEPFYADSGAVVQLALPLADSTGDVLLLETAEGRVSEPGLVVEAPDSSGAWRTLARLHPRRHANTHAVPLAGERDVRLRFSASCVVRFAGRFTQVSPTSVSLGGLRTAVAAGVDQSEAARLRDGVRATVPALDTLRLAFDEPISAGAQQRDWYILLEGAPVAAEVAAFLRGAGHDAAEPPVRFALHQNVPNPFSNNTVIAFDLPVAADARLDVFDAQGRLVYRVSEHFAAGRHAVDWDLRDRNGRLARPGIYAYRLRAGGFVAQRKMVVMP